MISRITNPGWLAKTVTTTAAISASNLAHAAGHPVAAGLLLGAWTLWAGQHAHLALLHNRPAQRQARAEYRRAVIASLTPLRRPVELPPHAPTPMPELPTPAELADSLADLQAGRVVIRRRTTADRYAALRAQPHSHHMPAAGGAA